MYGILPWLWLNSDGHNIIVYLGFKVSFLQVLQKKIMIVYPYQDTSFYTLEFVPFILLWELSTFAHFPFHLPFFLCAMAHKAFCFSYIGLGICSGNLFP